MRHPLWFLATSTALLSSLGWHATLSSDSSIDNSNQLHSGDCPFYGCPLTPQDVHYNTELVKHALERLRQGPRTQGDASSQELLSSTGNHDSVTLTLIGYKGGPLQDQVNQDRALVVNPFHIHTGDNQDKAVPPSDNILLGVFDGHAPKGEDVSEFTKSELPVLLSKKLADAILKKAEGQSEHDEGTVKQILIDTFVELDARAPAEESGGCTATVVLKLQDKVFVANTGDSRSFLVSYRAKTGDAHVLYMSREDKPNLPDERARVEALGGQVYIPIRGTSRVVYHDPRTGAPSGLAMSRSIGDWAAGKLGVIPHPIVDAIDIADLVDAELGNSTSAQKEEYAVNNEGTGNVIATKATSDGRVDDDVYIFAVCATDGMMDYLEAIDIASVLGKALFGETGAHPITAVEHLVFAAANAWQQDKQGRYRDDISIAVSTLRKPPTSATHHERRAASVAAQ